MEVKGCLPVPRHPQLRPVRRRGGGREPAPRAARRAARPPLRRRGAAGDRRQLPAAHRARLPAASSSSWRRTTVYRIDGPVNLNRADRRSTTWCDRPRPEVPAVPAAHAARLRDQRPVRARCASSDVLLHHPFESLRAGARASSARRPTTRNVLAIKQTLYRTGTRLADRRCSLVAGRAQRQGSHGRGRAAGALRRGGQHQLGRAPAGGRRAGGVRRGRLQDPRQDAADRAPRRHDRLRRYVPPRHRQLPPDTARQYTDFGLLTADEDDRRATCNEVFQQLTGLAPRAQSCKRLLQSPFTLHERVLERIDRETTHARAGRPARIIAKMNALIEPQIIAGAVRRVAGRREDRPDRARRLRAAARRAGRVGQHPRALDRRPLPRAHPRLLVRATTATPDVYLLERRLDGAQLLPPHRGRVPGAATSSPPAAVEDLEPYLDDNCQAWVLQSDGNYLHEQPGAREPVAAQTRLMQTLAG